MMLTPRYGTTYLLAQVGLGSDHPNPSDAPIPEVFARVSA
jgi:hypothetical protein